MDKEQEVPEKRFEDYQQVFNSEAVAIGFTLPGSEFLFKYDSNGGWKDEKGNYYNSKGVLQKVADGHSDDEDEEDIDEQELDEFERMLDDEGQPSKKQKKEEPSKQDNKNEEKESESYESGTKKFLENYKNKLNIREGLPEQLHIFFKMRSKHFQRVKPAVEKTQSVAEGNEKIKQIKAAVQEQGKKLKEKNKWIGQNSEFEFSGAQLDEATYDRYWYGFVRATHENYQQILAQIDKSQQFALLEHKTYYALKSKFYLKKKMQETIKNLSQPLEGVEDDVLVKIEADNLPENFPVSFILDLCSFSGTPIDQLYSIKIVDDFKAQIIMSKKGALKFLNVEGYCHDDKQFIELDLEVDKDKKKLAKPEWFKVSVATDKQNPYKTHACELHDTLALEKSREEMVKLFSENQEKQNGKFRFMVGIKCLKKVLMFRGSSLDALKVELFEKK